MRPKLPISLIMLVELAGYNTKVLLNIHTDGAEPSAHVVSAVENFMVCFLQNLILN